MNNHKSVIATLFAAALISSFGFAQSAFDSGNSYFADYATRKAREAEQQGAFRFGVIAQTTSVSISGGQTVPLPAGLPVKLVGEAYHNRPETFVGYLAFKTRTIAFTIPRASVSAVERSDPTWTATMQQYQQIVAAFELAAQQARAASQQQSAQTVEQAKQQLELLQMLQNLKAGRSSQGPTQYNGRPLPRNWIDPKQADTNFFLQQLQNQLRR